MTTDLRGLAASAVAAIENLQAQCGTQSYASLCAALRAAAEQPPTLSAEAIEWLARGDRGASSDTLFTVLTGIDALRGTAAAHPTDANAFGRCRKLVEACPEIAGKLPAMRFNSPHWRAVIGRWQPLCDMMDREAPNWRINRGTAPGTFAMIRETLASEKGEGN